MKSNKTLNINMDFVRARLNDVIPDGDEDTTIMANDASQGLYEIRGFFYGTPMEGILTEMIEFCDEVSQIAEPK